MLQAKTGGEESGSVEREIHVDCIVGEPYTGWGFIDEASIDQLADVSMNCLDVSSGPARQLPD